MSAGPATTRDNVVKVTLTYRQVPGRGAGDALERVKGYLPWVLLKQAAYRLGADVTVEFIAY